jgi:hypothetical protein
MRRALSLAALIALLISSAATRPKPADLRVVEAAAHRRSGEIGIDGKVRNTGTKPIRGLVLLFDFMAPGRQVVTTQKAPVDEEILEPGQEAVFRVALNSPPRAVEFQIGAIDANERELRVDNPGPFVIE